MRRVDLLLLGSACALALAAFACTPPPPPLLAPAPAGFALFADGRRAASAAGVIYRVREEANEPRADLTFWSEALKKRMSDAGYVVTADGELEARGEKGYLLELAAPVGQVDYGYLVAIFVQGERIIIAEASGEIATLKAARAEILAAMGKITW